MSAVEAPVFTAERDGYRLRAFAGGGFGLDSTWYALRDLSAALTTCRVDEVELLAGLAGGALGLELRNATTLDGPLVLVDHRSAYRLFAFATIAAMVDGPGTLPTAAALWEDAAIGALVESARRLPADELERWIQAATPIGDGSEEARFAALMRTAAADLAGERTGG